MMSEQKVSELSKIYPLTNFVCCAVFLKFENFKTGLAELISEASK